jgi:poly [ADP-ribose] polymerase
MSGAEQRMYILTDTQANNNKFWEVSIDENDVVSSRNGRVGSKGQSRTMGSGRVLFERKIREKERKGYKAIDVVGKASSSSMDKAALASAAEDQIAKGDPVIAELVRGLAKINRHQIIAASGGQMDVDLDTGIITTPLGVVTSSNIASARLLLEGFEKYVVREDFDHQGFIEPLEQYLMLVPQKVGSKRGWHHDFIPDTDALIQQTGLLDQLESSIDVATQRITDAKNAKGDAPQNIFDVSLSVSEDKKLRKRIEKLFAAGSSRMHTSSSLKMSRVFDVSLGNMDRDYETDGKVVGGALELWHGTRAHNLMSILKSGLIIPKSSGSIHVTGRMFGDGLYFSDQSTKSLNYASGFWDGGRADNRCYMFLADVAMGRPFNPSRPGSKTVAPAGYDSVYARGGHDGVRNNEMIVYRTSQARLKYLVEFT